MIGRGFTPTSRLESPLTNTIQSKSKIAAGKSAGRSRFPGGRAVRKIAVLKPVFDRYDKPAIFPCLKLTAAERAGSKLKNLPQPANALPALPSRKLHLTL
jgi:hypothetical protein